MNERRRRFFEYIGGIVDIEKGEKVLEIGANKPLWREYSRDVGDNGLFVSLDLYYQIQKRSREELLRESQSMGENNFPEQLVTANAGRIPFGDNSFTLVMAHNYNGNLSPMLSEVFRVLTPGGRMCFSFISMRVVKNVRHQCLQLGFECENISLYQNPEDEKDCIWFFIAKKPLLRNKNLK